MHKFDCPDFYLLRHFFYVKSISPKIAQSKDVVADYHDSFRDYETNQNSST